MAPKHPQDISGQDAHRMQPTRDDDNDNMSVASWSTVRTIAGQFTVTLDHGPDNIAADAAAVADAAIDDNVVERSVNVRST